MNTLNTIFDLNSISIHITRAQTTDTGVYTCVLRNGRDADLRRSFDLRVKGLFRIESKLNLQISFQVHRTPDFVD